MTSPVLTQCDCCDYFTISKGSDHEICPLCFWEQDAHSVDDLQEASGANHGMTLLEGRRNFLEIGACASQFLSKVENVFARMQYRHEPRILLPSASEKQQSLTAHTPIQPPIARLTALDVYRDGGSLSVSFDDSASVNFTLFFGIKQTRNDGGRRKPGYLPPLLEQHIKVSRISPVTGLENFTWETKKYPITWEDAQQILSIIAPMTEHFASDYLWVFPELCEAAENRGGAASN